MFRTENIKSKGVGSFDKKCKCRIEGTNAPEEMTVDNTILFYINNNMCNSYIINENRVGRTFFFLILGFFAF